MVVIGLLTLVVLNVYGGGLPSNLAALMVYYLLPAVGSVHFLYLSREAWLPKAAGKSHARSGA